MFKATVFRPLIRESPKNNPTNCFEERPSFFFSFDTIKSMVLYSIIIPTKNIPNLLHRCLNSIPTREDIQVIVVDDNYCGF